MGIYGVGAKYDRDVTVDFITNKIIATGWEDWEAPDVHMFFCSLRVGDVVYLKSCGIKSDITVKGIGIIVDEEILNSSHPSNLVEIGRNVRWFDLKSFVIPAPIGKNNVRLNTIFREYHPDVIKVISRKVKSCFIN